MTPTGERQLRRLPVDEVVADLLLGRQVLLVGNDPGLAVAGLDSVVRRVEELRERYDNARQLRVTRASGLEGVEDLGSGGRLAIASRPTLDRWIRGRTVDVAYVAMSCGLEVAQRLVPAMAPVNGEIVWVELW